jgi:hypothetical protein
LVSQACPVFATLRRHNLHATELWRACFDGDGRPDLTLQGPRLD